MRFGFIFISISLAPSGLQTQASFSHSFQKNEKKKSNKNAAT